MDKCSYCFLFKVVLTGIFCIYTFSVSVFFLPQYFETLIRISSMMQIYLRSIFPCPRYYVSLYVKITNYICTSLLIFPIIFYNFQYVCLHTFYYISQKYILSDIIGNIILFLIRSIYRISFFFFLSITSILSFQHVFISSFLMLSNIYVAFVQVVVQYQHPSEWL